MKRALVSVAGSALLLILLALAIYEGLVKLSDLSLAIAPVIVGAALGLLAWGFKDSIEDLVVTNPNVTIQEGSLRFNKYPYLLMKSRSSQNMPNISYGEVTVENTGKKKAQLCEMEILLKEGVKEVYRSKVLSADSTRVPNPMATSVDVGGTAGFHPICLELGTLRAFMPNHSQGVPGAFDGTLVRHAEYEMSARVLYDGKQSRFESLGRVKVPEDLVEKSVIPNDVQVQLDQGWFAVYLELHEHKLRARIYGKHSDDDVKRVVFYELLTRPQMDNVLEDNGKLREWKVIDLNTQSLELADVS